MTEVQPPAPRPCEACPYRRDSPGGIWHPDEYLLLPLYDRETPYQPTGIFMCHLNNDKVCAGWAGCHDCYHLFALRIAQAERRIPEAVIEAIMEYSTTVPLWASGYEAALNGLRGVVKPTLATRKAIAKLERIRADRE
jgi:hypothetical protein